MDKQHSNQLSENKSTFINNGKFIPLVSLIKIQSKKEKTLARMCLEVISRRVLVQNEIRCKDSFEGNVFVFVSMFVAVDDAAN